MSKNSESLRAYKATYYITHREEIRKQQTEYYRKNREYILLKVLDYSQKNHEKIKKYQDEYRTKNAKDISSRRKTRRSNNLENIRKKEKEYAFLHRKQRCENQQRRDARKRGAPISDFTKEQWATMLEHYGHRCVYCGRKMQRLTMDHITPLSKGGNHTQSNIVPACRSCNSKKHTGAPLIPVQPLLL